MTTMGAGPVAEVLARATRRESVRPDDARAGAEYQRVVADGQAYFLKRLSPATDWIMRVTGDHVHRPYLVWQAGIMGKCPRRASTTPSWPWQSTEQATTPSSAC